MKYADDSVLYVSDKDITIIEHLLNEDFANFCSWLQDNELIINTKKGKTEFMIFGTSIRLSRLNNPPMNLNYQGISVNNITSYKYLGISLNQTLNMTNHFSSAIKKSIKSCKSIKKGTILHRCKCSFNYIQIYGNSFANILSCSNSMCK